jgi:hypothetical protein
MKILKLNLIQIRLKKKSKKEKRNNKVKIKKAMIKAMNFMKLEIYSIIIKDYNTK